MNYSEDPLMEVDPRTKQFFSILCLLIAVPLLVLAILLFVAVQYRVEVTVSPVYDFMLTSVAFFLALFFLFVSYRFSDLSNKSYLFPPFISSAKMLYFYSAFLFLIFICGVWLILADPTAYSILRYGQYSVIAFSLSFWLYRWAKKNNQKP